MSYFEEVINLRKGDQYVITPGRIHWATSQDEALVELYSVPGWTKEDHIVVATSPPQIRF